MSELKRCDITRNACWEQALNDAEFAMQRTNDMSLIVCSALKKNCRDQTGADYPHLSFIHLKGSFDISDAPT